jgi:hypothetical protein
MVSPPAVARAQWSPNVDCTGRRADYITCALVAGNVPDLRAMPMRSGDREIRFWRFPGMGVPDELLIIDQRGDSVTAREYLIYTPGSVDSSHCGETWVNAVGALCLGRPAPRDWARMLRELDSAGLREMPGQPVPAEPCRPPPGVDPRLYGCAVKGDGISNTVEYRDGSSYWLYDFVGIPDTTAPAWPRDVAVLRLLNCVLRGCRDSGQ